MDGSGGGRLHLDGAVLSPVVLCDGAKAIAVYLLQKRQSGNLGMSAIEKIYRDADVDSSVLKEKVIAVIGYGIQGKVQAANCRDSGCKVIIGARPSSESKSREQAKADGFEALSVTDAT